MNQVLRKSIDKLPANTTVIRQTQAQAIDPLPFVGRGARLLILLLFAIFFGVPLLWLFLAPTKTNSELFTLSPFAFGSLQNVAISWQRLVDYNNSEIINWTFNSIYYAIGSLVVTLLASIPAGYALAVIPFKGRHTLLMTTLVVMILPAGATVLPLFLEMNAFHLIDNALAIILPSSFFPFGVYLTYIYFSTTLPSDLLDAGRVDGCSELQLFTSIALPLGRPIMSLVAFFSFVAGWNNYFLPFVMLTDDTKYNLPVGLGALMSSAPGVHPAFATELKIYGPEEALAGVIVILPILILFLFSQRALIAGMVGGAVKG